SRRPGPVVLGGPPLHRRRALPLPPRAHHRHGPRRLRSRALQQRRARLPQPDRAFDGDRPRADGPFPRAERPEDHGDRLHPESGRLPQAAVRRRRRLVPDPRDAGDLLYGPRIHQEFVAMATVTRPSTTTRSRSAYRTRPASTGIELWTWYFMRVSGIVLIFLVLGHFTIVHIL